MKAVYKKRDNNYGREITLSIDKGIVTIEKINIETYDSERYIVLEVSGIDGLIDIKDIEQMFDQCDYIVDVLFEKMEKSNFSLDRIYIYTIDGKLKSFLEEKNEMYKATIVVEYAEKRVR